MNHWSVRLISRAMLWAVLGGVCTASVGALCGTIVGAIITHSLDWEVSYIAGYVGMLSGGLAGLVILFVLNFFCSSQRGLWCLPLRFVLLGMIVGAASGLLVAVTVAVCTTLRWNLAWGSSWWDTMAITAIYCGPIGMILGQIAGGVYTALVSERGQHQRELARWKDIIESDYDLPYAHRSR